MRNEAVAERQRALGCENKVPPSPSRILPQASPSDSGPKQTPSVDRRLLDAIRAGSREAAASFVIRHEQKIRRRYRNKMGPHMRRLYDSMELLSTVLRRLDRYIVDQTIEANSEGALWKLVFRIADNALIDRVRVTRRLRRVDEEHRAFAEALLRRVDRDPSDEAFARELEAILRRLPNPEDRELLCMWLNGTSLAQIADLLGVERATMRRRWATLRERLRTHLLQHGA